MLFRSDVDRVGIWVAEDNGITVASKSSEAILESLTLDSARGLWGDGNGASAKALHGGVEGGRGASGWLVEHSAKETALEKIKNTLALNSDAHLLCHREQQVKVGTSEL